MHVMEYCIVQDECTLSAWMRSKRHAEGNKPAPSLPLPLSDSLRSLASLSICPAYQSTLLKE